jgi:hypothetical protein
MIPGLRIEHDPDITSWHDFRAHFRPLPRGCWAWIGPWSGPYGQGHFEGRSEQAHTIAFIVMRGSRNPALERDYLCCYQACVNPFHLEEVTHQENMRRVYHRRCAQAPPAFAQHRCCVPLC